MRRPATIAALAVLVVGAAVWWIPYLTRERDYAAAVAQPLPISQTAFVVLGASQQACFGPVALTTDSGQARFQVGTYFRPGPPMAVTVTGPGYAQRASVPEGFADNTAFRVPVRSPPKDLLVDVCIANRGDRRVALHAAADRTKIPYVTRVDGRAQAANPDFAFYAAERSSIVDHLPRIMRRISLFKFGFIGPWLMWPLLLVVALGVPLGALWALRRALTLDEEETAVRPPAA
jgi:hypothetical protein